MRITEHFNIGRTQHELDFVDVDTDTDTPLFIDPYSLAFRQDDWSARAHQTLRNYFQTLLRLIRSNRIDQARDLLRHLHEPNETSLGFSKGRPRGRAVDEKKANAIFEAILESRAVETGLIEHLEDFRVFVDNVGRDTVSDMTTNIIRDHLINYTQSQCDLWDIPLRGDVPSGFYWDRTRQRWHREYREMLVIDERPILLVPKAIVSRSRIYSAKQYHRHFVLTFLQDEHLRKGSYLVRDDGRVTKKDLEESEAPCSKEYLVEFTERHPDIFREFREDQNEKLSTLSSKEIAEASSEYEDDEAWAERWRQLQPEDVVGRLEEELEGLEPGHDDAERFHRVAAAILEFIFYPDLICPYKEDQIHQGRKRIDLTFANAAEAGLFFQLPTVHGIASQYIMVECKNYSTDPANPELDQLAGRFSVNRGEFGLLLVRRIEDHATLLERCRDTYRDGRGVIIPIEDADLLRVLDTIRDQRENPVQEILRAKMRDVQLT